MFESMTVGIFLRATSTLARVVGADAIAMRNLNSHISTSTKLLKQREEALKANAALFAGLAGVGAYGISVGIKSAGDLELAMVSAGIATGTASTKLASFYDMAFRLSGITAQSVTTIASEMGKAAASGLSRSQLMTAFPQIAKAADVMYLSPKHMDPVESVGTMTSIAHLFGAYSGKPLSEMLNDITRMMFLQPEGVERILTQGRLYIAPALARGISMEDIFRQTLTMGQTGNLRSRGGSGLANVIEALGNATTLTGHLQAAQRSSMTRHGLMDSSGRLKFVDERGNILLQRAIDHLETLSKAAKNRTAFANDILGAFQKQGGRYMNAILLPAVYAQSQRNWQRMQNMQDVDGMWKRFSDTFNFGVLQFKTNVTNVLAALFLPLLPRLSQGLHVASNELGLLTQWLRKHPKAAAAIAIAAFAGVAGSALFAAKNLWELNTSILALGLSARGKGALGAGEEAAALTAPTLLSRVGTFFRGLLEFLPAVLMIATRFIPWIAVATAAIGAFWVQFQLGKAVFTQSMTGRNPIIDALSHWWDRSKGAIGYTIGYVFGSIGRQIVNALQLLWVQVGATIGSLVQNIPMLFTDMQGAIAKAQSDANYQAGVYAREHHVGFGQGFMGGLGAGYDGHAFKYMQPPASHVTLHTTVTYQTGTPDNAKATANLMIQTLVDHFQGHSATTGSAHPVLPQAPTSLGFGSALWAH